MTVYDVVPQKGFLVMQYCPEGALRDRLARGRLSLSDAVDFAIVLLRTLGDIHAQGYAHLDIKPSNILLNDGLPVLSDFGVASKREKASQVGTHAYMSPEQAAGQIGQPSDVYALGLVLYECFTGRQPKAGGITPMSLEALPNGPKRHALESLINPMLAYDANERPRHLHRLASQIALAAALPETDTKGLELLNKLRSWVRAEHNGSEIALESHPIIAYLSRLDLKEKSKKDS